MNIFSEFQSKFPSKYSGQYIQEIIKSIGIFELDSIDKGVPTIIQPFFKALNISITSVTDLSIESEIHFPGKNHDRRVDLAVKFINGGKKIVSIFIEIKVDDNIIKAREGFKYVENADQLDDYISWLEKDADEDRYFILFTAHPIKESEKIRLQNVKAKHLYFGSYSNDLLNLKNRSPDSMSAIFLNYLKEEGYVMYKPELTDKDDFLSFMTLNFLQSKSGHGRIVSARKITNGPVVFSKLVNNWQLISRRINAKLKSRGAPAIRYLPEQVTSSPPLNPDLTSNFTDHRLKMRKRREFGRMWLISEVVVHDKSRISWCLVYSISNRVEKDEASQISCQIIVGFRTGATIHCECVGKISTFEKYSLKNAEDIESEIIALLRDLNEKSNLDNIFEADSKSEVII